MAKAKTRARDAGTGKIVSKAEAEARPKETVTEKVDNSLSARVALLEQVIEEAGGRPAYLLRRRRAGLTD